MNTYRSTVKILLLYSIIFLCLIFSFTSIWARQNNDPTNEKSLTEEILSYVNEHRAALKLAPLQENESIEHVAINYSRDMASHKVPFGHDGFEERVGNLLKELRPAHAGAENIADGDLDAHRVVELWLHSPGHRKNIEGDFNLTGIGVAKSADGRLYFTQIFIRKN